MMPPRIGASTMVRPIIPPQTAQALARSPSPWKACPTIASAGASRNAAPTPWAARARYRADAAEEDLSPAEAVCDRSRREQQRGEAQHIGADYPLDLGEARAEVEWVIS